MNYFAYAIIILFTLASVPEFMAGNTAKGWFYILSAGINLNLLFLR